jgi:predicted RNA-binding Zn-ribbon protein involved in translation (DUF1610 family)
MKNDQMIQNFSCVNDSCKKQIGFSESMSFARVEGATVDCPHCGTTMILKSGKALDFHSYLNSQNPSWPKDGKGASYVTVSDND